ncbi:46240_t:CDS:2, partial [Gigaspora margarita]
STTMMNSFLINTAFLNTVSKLRKHFDNTQVFEIRITPTTIECYNKEDQNDIRIKNISDHPLKEIVEDKWEDRVVYIRDKIRKSHLNQITLLEYYYFLGEHLEDRVMYIIRSINLTLIKSSFLNIIIF